MATSRGQVAEALAAEFLQVQGLKIIARNWRSRFNEIDIVARSDSGWHFVEVKYRRHNESGSGFDYITPDKQRRLVKAAAAWLHEAGHSQDDYQIDVIAIGGNLAVPQIDYLPNAVTG